MSQMELLHFLCNKGFQGMSYRNYSATGALRDARFPTSVVLLSCCDPENHSCRFDNCQPYANSSIPKPQKYVT